MDPTVLAAFAIIAIAIVYGVVPIMAHTYYRFRGPRTVRCPETGKEVQIELYAGRAAATAVPGPPELHVHHCALWPARQGCAERCVQQLS
jgi:hypothetical protein